MRRSIGVSAVIKKKDEAKKYQEVGKQMEVTMLSNVKEVLETFRESLAEFAQKHRQQINSDPEFRSQFHSMCLSLGVDPLASNKGFWADLLGVGDFYYELGILIVQICLQTRSKNGGIILLSSLLWRIRKIKKVTKNMISIDDILKAVDKLSVLGSGYKIIKSKSGNNDDSYLVSVPLELNTDVENIFSIAHKVGYVSYPLMMKEYQWTPERFDLSINTLLKEGIVWIDQYDGKNDYYFPSMNTNDNIFKE